MKLSYQDCGRQILPGLATSLLSILTMTSPATMPERARLVGSKPALAAAELDVTAWMTAPLVILSCLATASEATCNQYAFDC